MDVLIRLVRSRLVWAGVLLVCGVAACFVMPARREEPSFPHRVHVVDNELACTFCHGDVRSFDDPCTPPPELCAPCHDRFDAGKPAERRLAAFFGPEGRYRRVAVSGRTPDVVFSHRAHATAGGLLCTTCHADVADETEVPLAPLAKKSDCMECHASRGVANDCSACHRTIGRDWRPDSHGADWMRGHGERVRSGSEASPDRCSLCHEQASGCNACHQREAPRSHDNTFRVRTHGLMASIDRGRCAVCHTQDSCQQCHSVTRPQSHRGGFGAPLQRHCTGCHFPLQEQGCAVCHPEAGEHATTPLPANHVPSMNCRTCHGNGVRLPHPDGGHVCTECHR